MAFVATTFKLDLTPGAARQVLYTSQGDIGRPFEADLYWNGSPWTATGTTASIRGKKPDDTVFDYTATVSGTAVTFETTEQMTIISGPVECELVFSQGGDVIASANFVLIVEDSPYDPNNLSESEVEGLTDVLAGFQRLNRDSNGVVKIGDGVTASGTAEPIKGFYVHDEETNTDGVAKFSSEELEDIRVGADGTTYANAGDAVRAQGKQIKSLVNCKRWWKLDDLVFNGLSQKKQNALMCISKFDVHVYGNATMEMYNVSVANDGAFSLAIRFVSPEGITSTYPISLPAVSSYTETTYNSAFFNIDIGYTSPSDITGSIFGYTYIGLETFRHYNKLTDNAGYVDARLIPKVELADNVTNLTVERMRNITTGTYKYYALFTATLKSGETVTGDNRYTDTQSGIVKNHVAGCTVYVDADVLQAYVSRLYGTHAFDIDLMYCDVINKQNYQHIKNNLISDGIDNLQNCVIRKNGNDSFDNYGQDNARYIFTFDKKRNVHVYFEYQLTDVPVRASDSQFMTIASIYDLCRSDHYIRPIGQYTSKIYRTYMLSNYALGIGNTSDTFGMGHNNNIYNGNTAFKVKYTGAETSDVTLDFASETVTLKHSGSTIGSVTYSGTDTVDSLVNKLNNIEDLECVSVETSGKTCSELLPAYNDVSVNLIYSYTDSNNVSHTDASTVNIPYALNTEWHSCEIIVDVDNLKSYVAIDGRTIPSNIKLESSLSTSIIIGGTYLGEDAPIRLRNLEIDYGNFGDAEIINSIVPPYSTVNKQLISNHNPRLLIFEGHGVDIGRDADAPYSDNMAVTTDRLMTVFETLKSKGYKPVTWEQIIKWKCGDGSLPKRCFTLMMDDWRFENYVNYNKRIPFEKYNVKPGLAVISDQHALTDEIVVDGSTYTAEQMIDIVNLAEWYPCSHTKDHRRLTDFSNSQLIELFKQDVLSCNAHNIHSDVIVYPFGEYNVRMNGILENTPFKIGVTVVDNDYNCKLGNNFKMPRVEIGTRETLENVLAPIV